MDKTQTAPELLPCPFCGGDFQTWSHVRDGRSVGCSKCGARFTQYHGRDVIEERLANLWNTRADLYATQQATIDALTAALEAITDVCGEREGVWKGMRWIDGDELEEAWGKARAALASPTG
jgi:hypothetical protein